MPTRDADIRPALMDFLAAEATSDNDLSCIEELGICGGESRVDFAVLGSSIHGYEIKSESDSLSRLQTQIGYYCRALAFVTAVVAEKHCNSLLESAPSWWGVLLVKETADGITVERARTSRRNPSLDPYAVAQFLWRDEALELLSIQGLDSGVRAKPRKFLWERLCDSIEIDELVCMVSEKLQQRREWRLQKLAC